jgi:hypothetical protein
VKKFENLGITSIVTGDKLKIEISIAGLVSGFNGSSNNNYEEITVRRGKRQEFAEYIAKRLIDGEDPDTGNSPVMDMLDKVFDDVFQCEDYNEEIFKYPEEEGAVQGE